MAAELHLLRPLWLLALLPLAGLLLALWRARGADSAWRNLVDPHLLPYLLTEGAARVRRWPLVLLGLGWLLGVLALAGPVWERLPQPVFGTTARRVILLDLSPSMNAADVAPSRLKRAGFEVLDLLRATREGQIALIAFGPEPFVVSPLTGDAQTIAAQVPRLASDLLPVPGPRRTELALDLAGDLLRQAGAQGGQVILIADAIDGAPAIAAAGRLADAGVQVSVLGVGTRQGAPEPGRDGGFVTDRAGGVRISRLDRQGLEALARAGKGLYLEPDPGDRDTRALIAGQPGGVRQETLAQPGLAADRWREEGPWLLLLLLPLAALGFRRGWLLPVLLLVAVLPPSPGWALGWDDLWARADQQGARALAAGDGPGAATHFEDPAWRAAARYRAGDYAGALQDLAGLTGPEADYNRGNALARLGRLDQAIDAYEKTLAQAPGHADARENLDLVRRLKARQAREAQSAPQDQDQDREQGKGQQGQDGQRGSAGDGTQDQARQDSRSGQSGQGQQGQSAQGGQQGQSGQQAGQQGQQGQSAGQGERNADARSHDGAAQAGRQPQSGPDGQGAAGGQARSGERADGDQSASAPARSQSGGGTGQSPTPGAGDFGQDALDGDPAAALKDQEGAGGFARSAAQAGPEGKPDGQRAAAVSGEADLTPEQRELKQSMEAQLQRVPDDPAGLLRQRFMLQHLRREGRLP